MKVLVCGGRDYENMMRVYNVLSELHEKTPITLIISGCARGPDTFALKWADDFGVPSVRFPADWQKHGRAAGPIRNQQMLDEGKPDLVVAFPGGRGTADMMSRAAKAGCGLTVVDEACYLMCKDTDNG